MMDRSREARGVRKKRTGLDWLSFVGWALWWGGLVLQMLWHVRNVSGILAASEGGMADPDESWWSIELRRVVDLMPAEDSLIRASLIAGVLSSVWNPQLVQVIRGFTKHLLGLRQWYSFQALIVASRFVFRSVVDVSGQPKKAQLSAHLVMAALMSLVYVLATRAIRFDTTPLFGSHNRTVSPKQPTSSRTGPQEKIKSFSDVLNEALDAPNVTSDRPRAAAIHRHTLTLRIIARQQLFPTAIQDPQIRQKSSGLRFPPPTTTVQ